MTPALKRTCLRSAVVMFLALIANMGAVPAASSAAKHADSDLGVCPTWISCDACREELENEPCALYSDDEPPVQCAAHWECVSTTGICEDPHMVCVEDGQH